MELESIVKYFENKSILVTGATGFLAKIFVEKILRIQPNVKKFYLLLRATDAKSAMDRLRNEVIGKELFKVLREKHGESLNRFVLEKVTPVAGDVSKEDLGVKDSCLRDQMCAEIDLVLNFAATTDFDDRYDVSLGINTFGALNVLNFAKKCVNIKKLVHVSTAYVCGEDAGLIPETPYEMGETKRETNKIDIDVEKKLVQQKLNQLKLDLDITEDAITSAMKDFGIKRARLYGWPNTYVFTKTMGEMLVYHLRENIPLVIIRPTMVASTYKDPFPGWIEGLRTIDSLIAGYAKGRVTCFISHPHSPIDVIPADMVVNGIIVSMATQEKEPSKTIYHLGSSLRNPVYFSQLHDISFRHFTEKPWISKNGQAVKIRKGTVLSSMTSFYTYMAIHYLLPLKALSLVNTVLFQKYKDTYNLLSRKIQLVMRLVDLYEPYVFFEGIFDDTNSQNLRVAAREKLVEADMFNFDPKSIDWEDYMMNAHIPGLTKHVMKR